ncbi:polysaccharide pyruvyl transferase family protein [Derxia lacustris]|uniref:polysaccharide pyruvyl transferase family protein n=1 Tax=Derxia lacustris TaxID=764842 RepID=UPI001594C1E6|nr:polysaccharide pyruvyl transferase family protein [Derxia lacustris]
MAAIADSTALARRVWRKSGLKTRWKSWRLDQLIAEWSALCAHLKAPAAQAGAPETILFIPPDMMLLVASRGDEAMISVLQREMRERFPEARQFVLTHGAQASAQARSLGMRPIEIRHEGKLAQALKLCLDQHVTHCITIGADVLDGSYDPVFSAELLALTDLLARSGVHCAVNGFSFSDRPFPGLAQLYEGFSRNVVFNLRDPVSFERFRRFSSATARLTADAAFLLPPANALEGVGDFDGWINSRKAAGREIVGINIHPLLLELEQRERVPELCAAFSRVLEKLALDRPLAFVLLEHDFRGSSSDYHCIDRVEDQLRATISPLVYRFPRELKAAEVKRVVGVLDGVITGRMHLSIATLGAGVPVFLIDYKAKMEGLLQHFELDREMRLPACVLFDEEGTRLALLRFLAALPALRAQVVRRLPAVKALAHANLDAVLDPQATAAARH